MLCCVGPLSSPVSNHPKKSRSRRAYGALRCSSRCAICCATELFPEPYTPVMSTAPCTPRFTAVSYLLLPVAAIGGGDPLAPVGRPCDAPFVISLSASSEADAAGKRIAHRAYFSLFTGVRGRQVLRGSQ